MRRLRLLDISLASVTALVYLALYLPITSGFRPFILFHAPGAGQLGDVFSRLVCKTVRQRSPRGRVTELAPGGRNRSCRSSGLRDRCGIACERPPVVPFGATPRICHLSSFPAPADHYRALSSHLFQGSRGPARNRHDHRRTRRVRAGDHLSHGTHAAQRAQPKRRRGGPHDLGASKFQTFRYIVLPNLRIPLLTASILAFALSFDETMITLFLTGTDATLPVRLYAMMRVGFTPEINALITLILLFSIVLTVAVALAWRRNSGLENNRMTRI